MNSIDRARELFDRLEGRRIDGHDVALRAFEAQDRLSQIKD